MSSLPYKVSVVLPTYNGARFLSETLNSIATQSHPVSQLVCSDDGSDDQTLSILEEFAKSVNFDVVVLNHERNGVTANYLNALSKAQHEIILIADQDDVWLPHKAQAVVAEFANPDVQLVSHDCLIVNERLQPLGGTLRGSSKKSRKLCLAANSANDIENLQLFLRGNLPLLAHTLAFRSVLIPSLLNKPADIQEWWFEEWVSCIAMLHGRLHLVDDHLVLYRQHNMQTSGGFQAKESRPLPTGKKAQGKYSLKIEKVRYCAQYLKDRTLLKQRQNAIEAYLSFLECRQSIIVSGKLQALPQIAKQCLVGNYHRHGQGLKSVALDVLTIIRN